MFDSETGVYEAIEILQDSSNCGFRFITDFSRFTARRDDNERPVSAEIRTADIADIGEIEIDMNRENYATVIDVPYNRNYYRDQAEHYEGAANRANLLALYGVDRVYSANSYLLTEDAAKDKARRLERFFRRPRPLINGVRLINHPDLRVYDIITIDLRIPLERGAVPRQAAVLRGGAPERDAVIFGSWPGARAALDLGEEEEEPYREFGGVLTCKVMSVKLDLETMVNTADLLEAG